MQLEDICYHHYSLTFDPNEIKRKFSDVRFLLIAGCANRVDAQAKFLVKHLFNGEKQEKLEADKLTRPNSRFTLFKIGPVLVSNHGMGSASMSIAMHELFIMCQQANVIDKITLIRFGTCGGVGVAPGTICITNRAYDPLFQEFVELKICMRLVRRDCVVDLRTADELAKVAREYSNKDLGNYEVKLGGTIAANDFYEEQGRTNGSICEHSLEDKMRFIKTASERGVINMEMESNFLAAMCHKLNVKFGVVCVALTNRLLDDKVNLSSDQMVQFEERLFWLNAQFIHHKLSSTSQ